MWVETVFPGMWRRSLFEEIGAFDPEMVANEDNEFSYRIRRSGRRIWYDPSIVVEYVPRGSLRQLFGQYRNYGFGKIRVWRKHHGGLRWRHLVPATWLALVVVGGLLAWVLAPFRLVFLGLVVAYIAIIVGESVRLRRVGGSVSRIAAALMTLHLAYAVGSWKGLSEMLRR
jgi:GT2 family glycosyltransferase